MKCYLLVLAWAMYCRGGYVLQGGLCTAGGGYVLQGGGGGGVCTAGAILDVSLNTMLQVMAFLTSI